MMGGFMALCPMCDKITQCHPDWAIWGGAYEGGIYEGAI